MPWLWAVFTVVAAGGQVLRNAMQKELTATLGTVGATHVRFLFGLPFALVFLALVLAATRLPVPELNAAMIAWTAAAALAQIAATALLLAAMQARSFVVTTAYAKTEPVQVAIFGLAFLGDKVTPGQALAILIATAGVLIMSWPRSNAEEAFSWKPAALGIGSGALFAIAAIGYRGGILALGAPNFVVGATTTLVLGLVIQTVDPDRLSGARRPARAGGDLPRLAAVAVCGLHGRVRLADVVPGLRAGDGRQGAHAGADRDPVRAGAVAQSLQAERGLARDGRDRADRAGRGAAAEFETAAEDRSMTATRLLQD